MITTFQYKFKFLKNNFRYPINNRHPGIYCRFLFETNKKSVTLPKKFIQKNKKSKVSPKKLYENPEEFLNSTQSKITKETPVQSYNQPNTRRQSEQIFQTRPDILADRLKIKDMLRELHLKDFWGDAASAIDIMAQLELNLDSILATPSAYQATIDHPNFAQRFYLDNGTEIPLNLKETKAIQDYILSHDLETRAKREHTKIIKNKEKYKYKVMPTTTVAYLEDILTTALEKKGKFKFVRYVLSLLPTTDFTALLEHIINGLYTQSLFVKQYKIKAAEYIGCKLADHLGACVKKNKKIALILSAYDCKSFTEFHSLAETGKLPPVDLISPQEFIDYIKKDSYENEKTAQKYLHQLLFVILNHKNSHAGIIADRIEIHNFYTQFTKILGYEILTILLEAKVLNANPEVITDALTGKQRVVKPISFDSDLGINLKITYADNLPYLVPGEKEQAVFGVTATEDPSDTIMYHLKSNYRPISQNPDFIVEENIPNKIDLSKWTINLPVTKVILETITRVVYDNGTLIYFFNHDIPDNLPKAKPTINISDYDLKILSALFGINLIEEQKKLETCFFIKILLGMFCFKTNKKLMTLLITDVYQGENALERFNKLSDNKYVTDLINTLQAQKYLLPVIFNNIAILINFKQFHFKEVFDSRFRGYMSPSTFNHMIPLCQHFLSFDAAPVEFSKEGQAMFDELIPQYIRSACYSEEVAEALIKDFLQLKTQTPEEIRSQQIPVEVLVGGLFLEKGIKTKEFFTLFSLLRDLRDKALYPVALQKAYAVFGVDSSNSGVQMLVALIRSAPLACASKLISPKKLEKLAKKQHITGIDFEFFNQPDLYTACGVVLKERFLAEVKKNNIAIPQDTLQEVINNIIGQRFIAKTAVMISFYNGGFNTQCQAIMDKYRKKAMETGTHYSNQDLREVNNLLSWVVTNLKEILAEKLPDFKTFATLISSCVKTTAVLDGVHTKYDKLTKQHLLLEESMKEFPMKYMKYWHAKHKLVTNKDRTIKRKLQIQAKNAKRSLDAKDLIRFEDIMIKHQNIIAKVDKAYLRLKAKADQVKKDNKQIFPMTFISYINEDIRHSEHGQKYYKQILKENNLPLARFNTTDPRLIRNKVTFWPRIAVDKIFSTNGNFTRSQYRIPELSPQTFDVKKYGSALLPNMMQFTDALLLRDLKDYLISLGIYNHCALHDRFKGDIFTLILIVQALDTQYKNLITKQDIYHAFMTGPNAHIMQMYEAERQTKNTVIIESAKDLDGTDYVKF